MWYSVCVILDLFEIAALVHQFDDTLAGCKAVLPLKFVNQRLQFRRQLQPFEEINIVLDRDRSIRRQNVDSAQFIALADFEIVEVVCRRDLDGTGTGFRVGIIVGND